MIPKKGKFWRFSPDKYFPFVYRDGRYVFLRGCRTKGGARRLLVGEKPPKGIMINE